ncbi:phage head morphogenesis protein [Pasteurellaceae bacterium USgator11]|nr:phage head morphogenesis protein [Pasteurellaceae bacterium USgator41]TNG96485.1 phage head morphogenesis protein [Pasteurellaceae bacterium UScroc12]TNH00472.1 phage head morphogenesis protein [Pasteurellaceae bacterium UScroc31]TNH01741.1 phage head morphogenesis protein [Pasteurellaceae bacterium USgator11]
MTVDERIEHALADRKILLFRYDAHLRQEVYKKLNRMQKALINRISAAGVESISKKELDKLLKEIQSIITDAYGDLSTYTSSELDELLPVEIAAAHQIYNKAVQFDLFNVMPAHRIKAIKDAQIVAGSPLHAWWVKQGNDVAFKFTGLIRQGMLEGRQTSELVTETKDLFSTNRRWAETLVRTAVMRVHDRASEALKEENLDIIKGEMHVSTLDFRTSDVCRVRDGKMWDLDKKPIGHDLPYRRPPLHPNCRSTLKLITKSWRELGFNVDEMPESTRASMDGQVKESLDYEAWLKGKTKAEQDAVLGKGKADMWRNGVITFRDMLDQSSRPITLVQLREKFKLGAVDEAVASIYRKAENIEPHLTGEMSVFAKRSGGMLSGLDYRLKSIDSLTRKVQSDIVRSGITEAESIDRITDIVRYTTIYDSKTFTQNYLKMQQTLAENGYNIIKVKNTWRKGAAYKGVNTIIEKDGFKFEMQYHTKQSFDLKNGKLHTLYEKARLPNISDSDLKVINNEMKALSDQLETPINIGKIRR